MGIRNSVKGIYDALSFTSKWGGAGAFIAGAVIVGAFPPLFPVGAVVMFSGTMALGGRQLIKGVVNLFRSDRKWENLNTPQKIMRVLKFTTVGLGIVTAPVTFPLMGAALTGMAIGEAVGKGIR